MAKRSREDVVRRLYPEVDAGGYIRHDGFVDFFARVRSLVQPGSVVLDFGAGRGNWNDDDLPPIVRELRDFQAKGAKVYGVDVDPVVLENPTLDDAQVIGSAGPLPYEDSSIDLIVADYVFEHVDEADAPIIAAELSRVLKSGGWLCARTPNRRGLISLVARNVPNRLHVKVLERLQPGRHAEDVFPTRYAMNTRGDLAALFPESEWSLITVGRPGVLAYAGSSPITLRAAAAVERLTPRSMAPVLMVFARKR